MEGCASQPDFDYDCSQGRVHSSYNSPVLSKAKEDVQRVDSDAGVWKPSWDFFSEPNMSVKVTNEISGRARVEANTRFLYLGRKNSFGSVTSIKISMFTATRLKALLEEILEQIEVTGENPDNKLLPYFHGNSKRAYSTPTKRSAELYWEQPDCDYGTIKVRMGFCTREGKYVMRVLSPVESPLFQGWCGPMLCFNSSEMRGLKQFITQQRALE